MTCGQIGSIHVVLKMSKKFKMVPWRVKEGYFEKKNQKGGESDATTIN